MATAEIHAANGSYAGYARFGANGEFQGTRGGYGTRTNPRNVPSNGRGNRVNRTGRGLRNVGNNARTGASAVQTAIRNVGMQQARRGVVRA